MPNNLTKFRSDILSGTSGTVLAYTIGLLTLPLITRFYTPEHIGVWQILLATIVLITPLATLQFEHAIVLERTKSVISRLLTIILFNTFIICSVIFFTTLLFGNKVNDLIDIDISINIGWMLIIGVLIQVSFIVLTALVVKQKRFKVQAVAKVLGSLTIPFMAVFILLFLKVGNTAYIVAAFSGILVQVFFLYRWVDKEYFPSFGRYNKGKILSAFKKYKVYPVYMVPYVLSQGAVWQITLISLGVLFSTSIVGAYTVARQIVYIPVSLLTASLKQVIFSHASSAPKYDESIKQRIHKLLTNIVNVAIPFTVFSFFYITDIINFLLGDGWEKVGVFSQWILIPAVALMLTSWLDRIFDVYGKQRLAVFLQISSDIAFLLVLLVCFLFETDELVTIISLSVFLALYNLAWLLIVLKILKFPTSFWVSLIVRIIVLAIVFLLLLKLIETWIPIGLAVPVKLLALSSVVYYTFIQIRGK